MKARPDPPPGPYLIVGLARSGMAAARALHARGERVVCVDRGAPDIAELERLGIELHVRGETLDLLEGAGTLIKSPGVPRRAPLVAAARAAGVTVIGELELAWRLLPNEFIAVTGTNGKTTTVELIGHIHRQAGLPVAVAGNVGTALSGLIGVTDPDVTIVCEASSFQLEDTIAFAPEAAVLLNIEPDHLDRHATLAAYTTAKLQIFARQGVDDVAVIPHDLAIAKRGGAVPRVRFGGAQSELALRDGQLCWEGRPFLRAREIRLRGAHNLQNAMAAAAACLARGVTPDVAAAALRSFAGVPHRLEEVATLEGVLYVNDSKATNVASTLVALDAMASDGLPVHVILGGQGKGQDFAPLAPAVARACRAAYLIGEDSPAIQRALASTEVPVEVCGDLEHALALARASARAGDVVLISPGCASFDQFTDFEARGARFRELVEGFRRSASN